MIVRSTKGVAQGGVGRMVQGVQLIQERTRRALYVNGLFPVYRLCSPVSFERNQIKQQVADLAANGIFIGTSSWKYPGWRGLLYNEARYAYRGRFAESRFEKNCLAEYAEVFKTVV